MDPLECKPSPALPAYDMLHDEYRQVTPPLQFDESEITPYLQPRPYFSYLQNPAYRRYVQMHKVIVRDGGSSQLLSLAQELEGEKLPEFLDASGWAYAESSLAGEYLNKNERMERLEQAEKLWQAGINAHDGLEGTELAEALRSDSRPFRLALNLAFTPLMKGIVNGDVTSNIRTQVYSDTLAIAQLVGVHCHLAWRSSDRDGTGELTGLIHECNALLALLHIDDPRYVPLPSSARADSGYYHADQTHDIVILNQHFGKIKKAIPVEVKAHPSGRDKDRYKALIIGKTDLTYRLHASAHSTLDAFAKVHEARASDKERYIANTVTRKVKTLLAEYQKADMFTETKMDTVSKFYNAKQRGMYRRQLGNMAAALAS